MSKSKYLISEFDLLGQLIDIVIKSDNKVKYLKLVTDSQEYWLKASKHINKINQIPPIGSTVRVQGQVKQNRKKGKIKYQAQAIKLIEPSKNSITTASNDQNFNQPAQQTTSAKQPKAKILVCKKSTCWARGGKAVCALLEENLRDRGLREQVEIKTTGCLKQCKKGPNIVMMPDKASYTRVQPEQVPALIDKHLVGAIN